MKETKTQTKIAVTEKDFTFLKKVNGLSEDILIKRVSIQEKGKKELKEATSVIAVDKGSAYMVQTTRNTPIFTEEKFGMKNIKGFLNAVTAYGEMEERPGDILFSSGKKKIIYKKLGHDTVLTVNLPAIDTTGYEAFSLNKEDIKEFQTGLKNELSDYASLIVSKGNKLILKIGELTYDNIYEQEIKDVTCKGTTEIKFLTKLTCLKRLFETIDDDSKMTLFLKAGNPLIFIEKGSTTNTKTIIAPAIDSEMDDEENIDEIVDGEGADEEEDG